MNLISLVPFLAMVSLLGPASILAGEKEGRVHCSFLNVLTLKLNSDLDKALQEVDPGPEHFRLAYEKRGEDIFYYGNRLTAFDERKRSELVEIVKLEPGKNITGRIFEQYLGRLGISEEDVKKSAGEKWLSVGEGYSDFTANLRRRGIDAYSVDAQIKNPFSPSTSAMAYAQSLPFANDTFDRTVSVWLIQHFFRPTAGSSMFNPEAGRKAILEMIRVTKKGGIIEINPILNDSSPIIDFLDDLKSKGLIDYQTSSPLEFEGLGNNRILAGGNQDVFIKITRKGVSLPIESPVILTGTKSQYFGRTEARSAELVRHHFFPKEAVDPEFLKGKSVLEFGKDLSLAKELAHNRIRVRLYDYDLEGFEFYTGLEDNSVDVVLNLHKGLDDWRDSVTAIKGFEEIARVLKKGGRVYFYSIREDIISKFLELHPDFTIVSKKEHSIEKTFYFELVRKNALNP